MCSPAPGIDATVQMARVDAVTQQNAPASEELAATASNLADQAGHLQEVVRYFRFEAGTGRSRPARLAPEGNTGVPRLEARR